ncbi:hypothetical protein PMAYCL1PPCAC_07966, partial [Pristionchus mayeri]
RKEERSTEGRTTLSSSCIFFPSSFFPSSSVSSDSFSSSLSSALFSQTRTGIESTGEITSFSSVFSSPSPLHRLLTTMQSDGLREAADSRRSICTPI